MFNNSLRQKLELKNTRYAVLLSIAMIGFYPILWIFSNQSRINELFQKEIISRKYTFILCSLYSWGIYFQLSGNRSYEAVYADNYLNTICVNSQSGSALVSLGILFGFICWIMILVWAFKMKKQLQKYADEHYHINFKMNPVYTFIFSFYYIIYCIVYLDKFVSSK